LTTADKQISVSNVRKPVFAYRSYSINFHVAEEEGGKKTLIAARRKYTIVITMVNG
jgi:hypothetical protein